MLRTIAILLAATVSTGAQIGQSFPHTNKYGRATIEYRHEGLGVVANYDYSQKNHSSPWLLIDVALGSADRFVLHRTNFKLVTPDGQTIPLASQQQGRDDMENINLLIQNAKIHRQNLDSYFPQRDRHEAFNFFSLPSHAASRTRPSSMTTASPRGRCSFGHLDRELEGRDAFGWS